MAVSGHDATLISEHVGHHINGRNLTLLAKDPDQKSQLRVEDYVSSMKTVRT